MTGRLGRWAITATALATAVTLWLGSSDTLGGYTAADVTNNGNTTASAMLAVSHAYGSTCSAALAASATITSCPGSLYPTTSNGTRTDTVTNTGTTTTAATTSTYRVAGCGAVSYANTGSAATAGPMLARTGTTFSPTSGPFAGAGSIAVDGTSYASAVNARTEPDGSQLLVNLGLVQLNYGYGIWFKTTATTIGPLFGITGTGGSDATTGDRTLYLTATGRIAFAASFNTGVVTATSTTAYNDGTWHFAYVMAGVGRVGLSLATTLTIWVDGATAATIVAGALNTTTGYWHTGWAPVGGTGRFFTGSLSGFTLDTDGAINAPAGKPTSYTPGTELWRLDDSGGGYDGSNLSGVYTGTTAFGGSNDACAAVAATWPLLGVAGTSLRALVAAGAKPATFPAPAASTAAPLTLATAQVPATLKGLLVYAPVRADYRVGTAWTLALTWAANVSTVAVA